MAKLFPRSRNPCQNIATGCSNQFHFQILSCNPSSSSCLYLLWPNIYKLILFPLNSTNLPTNIRKSWSWLLETQEINNTMSLNCLTCSQLLQRTDSYGELFVEKEYTKICKQVNRSWSSNMSSSTTKCELPKGGAVAKVKADHRRNYSTGDVPYPSGSAGPKLVRSSGMRRNWSFEDVAETQDQGVSCHWDQIIVLCFLVCVIFGPFLHCVYFVCGGCKDWTWGLVWLYIIKVWCFKRIVQVMSSVFCTKLIHIPSSFCFSFSPLNEFFVTGGSIY